MLMMFGVTGKGGRKGRRRRYECGILRLPCLLESLHPLTSRFRQQEEDALTIPPLTLASVLP